MKRAHVLATLLALTLLALLPWAVSRLQEVVDEHRGIAALLFVVALLFFVFGAVTIDGIRAWTARRREGRRPNPALGARSLPSTGGLGPSYRSTRQRRARTTLPEAARRRPPIHTGPWR